MISIQRTRPVQFALLPATLLCAAPALAAFNLPGGDVWLDGSFQGMTYGVAGVANLTPRLYIGEFASTLPPFDQIIGTGLEFNYAPPVFGASVLTVTYTLTNNDFDAWHDLRFFLDLKAKGQPAAQDVASVVGFGVPPKLGEPDQFRVFDFDAAGDKPLQLIEGANSLSGASAAACAVGCYTDLALQWNLPELPVGQTWQITATLVDNPALVGGGRYLTATTLGADGTQVAFGSVLAVPEPETYLTMLAGLGLLGWRGRLRRPVLA